MANTRLKKLPIASSGHQLQVLFKGEVSQDFAREKIRFDSKNITLQYIVNQI